MADKIFTMEGMVKAARPVNEQPPSYKNYTKQLQDLGKPYTQKAPAPVKAEESPSFLSEVLPAAARTSNFLFGAYHEALESEHHDIDPNFKFADHADELRKDIPEQYWDRLIQRSLGESQHERRMILGELHDKETLHKAGLVGTAAEFGMMLADAPTILGGFGEAFALGNMLTKGMRLKNFVTASGVGVAGALLQEGSLQSVTHTRDVTDFIYAGVGGATVGGALGFLSKHGKELSKSIMSDMDRKLLEETPLEYIGKKEFKAKHPELTTDDAFNAAYAQHLGEVDTHNNARKAALDKAVSDAPNMALHVHDTDMFDAVGNKVAEFVNGVKGAWHNVTTNDGSTTAMFIPWEGGVKRVPTKSPKGLTKQGMQEGVGTVEAKDLVGPTKETEVLVDSVPSTHPADVRDASGYVVPAPRDIMQEAVDLEKSGVFKKLTDTKVGKTLMKLGFTDSSYMLSQNSPLSKFISYHLLENGAGVAGRTSTAAIQKFQHLKVMLNSFMPDMSKSYKQFAHENGISHWNIKEYYGEGMRKWNREIRIEIEQRKNAFLRDTEHISTAKQHIQDAADALQRAADNALELGKAKGVRGFEDIVRQPGYVPLLWNGKALRLAGTQKRTQYEALLSKGYISALDLDPKDAKKIAKAVIRRALHKDIGLDTNPRALFSGDSRKFLREILEDADAGLSDKSINELFARIDARQADKGMSARAKRRTEIDLLVTDDHGNSLIDIVDNDLPMIFNRYSSEMSGRAALASKGITSEADWTRLRNEAIESAASYGDDHVKLTKILDSTYEQFMGRPAGGGVNKNVRRLMDMATVASLGQVGFAQMAEFAPIIAAHGIGGMFEMLPEVKAYRAALKNGTLDKGVLSELHVHTGRIGEEEMLFRPDIRLDDKLNDDPEWLRILDRGLGTLNNVSGKLSLMHQIKTIQHQFVVAMQANKVAKAVSSGDWSKLSARFADMGWDDTFMKGLQDVSKHFEFEGGTLQRLNIDKWHNPELTENFIQGLHRHTNQLVQMQMIGETAHWMHPTIGAMLTQFRTFPLVAMEKQTARHMLMADEEAMFTAMYGLSLSALVYTAKVGFNAIGKGKDRQEYLDNRLSIAGITKGAFQYANVAGPASDVSNFAVACGLAPKIMSTSNVGRYGGEKMANISMSDIPSLAAPLKLFNATTGIGKGLLDPAYNYSKKDVQNLQGGLPLGNTPFLTIPWNVAKDQVE